MDSDATPAREAKLTSDEKTTDLLIALYSDARKELISRLRLRDGAILLYLAGIGAVFGVAFGSKDQAGLLFYLPLLGLGAAFIVTQHDLVIGAIAEFCGTEMRTQIYERFPIAAPRAWDSSKALAALSGRGVRVFRYNRHYLLRTAAYVVLIVIPEIAAIIIADVLDWSLSVSILGTVIGGVLTVATLALILETARVRNRQWKHVRQYIRSDVPADAMADD